MSKTIDEKVVEMRFDNKQFETNVKTSLSTLDKLKAKLNLTGASKGLEEVSKASKSISFSNMENSLAALEKRFSTTGIVGMTVIQNLTNAAMNFAKQISSFSIGGIVEGGKSRATKIENARFQIKGLLKDYSDADKRLQDIMSDVNYGVESTAYGLDAAASVAAQLVASGKEAGDGMRAALRGISGVAAMTNSSYEEIGQIYTTVAGNGRLMSEQLLQLSSRGMNAAATLAKALGKSESEVRDMVSKGKIDFDTFAKAMDDAFGEHAKDANKTFNGVISNIKAALAKIGADFYEPIIAEDAPLIKFLNSVRERINEIRQDLKPITKDITDRINNFLTGLNKLFTDKNFLGYNPLAGMIDKIQEIKKILSAATEPVKTAVDTFNKAGEAVKDYEKLVDEIINGKWKNQPYRQKLLEDAGYNFYHAQNMVNERLGNSFRYADDYTEATTKTAEATQQLAENLENLSDEQLRSMGMTDEQISALNELKKMAEKTGIPLKELMELITQDDKGNDTSAFSTRYLILNSIKNVALTLVSVLKSVASAFGQVFDVNPEKLFDLIAALHKFTVLIRDRVEKNADKLTSTFKGLFSIIHLLTSLVAGGFKLALTIINKILGAFNLTILDVTAVLGEAIFKFDRWITSNNTFIQLGKSAINILVAFVKWIGSICIAVKDWIKSNEVIMGYLNKMKEGFKKFSDSLFAWTENLKNIDNVPKYIFEGLVNGLKNGAGKVYSTISEIASKIIEWFCKILGIHSPSTVFFAIGGFLIAGLIGGVQGKLPSLFTIFKGIAGSLINLLGVGGFVAVGALLITGLISGMESQSLSVFDVAKGIGNKLIDLFKQIDLGNVIAVGISIGVINMAKKMMNIIDKLTGPITGITNLLNGLGEGLENLGAASLQYAKSKKLNATANVIKSISLSIGILAASLWVLAKLPADQLKQGAIALGVVSGVLAAFVVLIAVFSKRLSNVELPDVAKILAVIVGTSLGMLVMSKALKNVGKIDSDKMLGAIAALIACAGAMAILLLAMGKVSNQLKGTKNVEKMSKVFTKMSISMLLIAIALKQMSKVQKEDMIKMAAVFGAMLVLLAAITALNKISDKSLNKAANTIIAVGAALLLLTVAMRLAGGLTDQDFKNGIKVVGTFLLLLTALMGISKIFKGTEMVKVSASILMVVAAIGLLATVTKLVSNMNPEAMTKGLICVGILSAYVVALIAISKKSASFHGTTLIGVATAIAVMSAAVWALGQLDPEKAKNGLKAVGALSLFMDGLILAAKNFNPGEKAMSTLITMTVMLSMLSVALVGLSFLDSGKLMKAAESLGAMLLSLAVVIKSISNLKPSKGTLAILTELTLVVAALATIIGLLSHFTNPEGAIASAGAVSLLLLAMSGVMAILSKMKFNKTATKNIRTGVLSLTAMVIPLVAFGAVLAGMSALNVQGAIENVKALSALMTVMTLLLAGLTLIGSAPKGNIATGIVALTAMVIPLIAFAAVLAGMSALNVQGAMENVKALSLLASVMTLLLIPLTAIGLIATTGIGAVAIAAGIIALTGMVVPLLAFTAALAGMSDIENARDKAELLTDFMTKMTKCLVAISLVAPLAVIADGAILGLVGVITVIGVLATGVGAIMDKFPQLQSFLDKGLPVLEQISGAIGKILGNLVGGFASGIADNLPNIGQKLSDFITAATPFITGAQMVNENVINGAKYLAASILALSGANLVEAFTSWISGGQSFSDLGTELSKFIVNAMPFIATLSTVKPEALEGAKNLSDALLAFTTSGLIDALGSKLLGDINYDDLGSKLGALGTGLSSFVTNLSGFTDDNLNMIKIACEGIKALAEAAKEMPASGGVWQQLIGNVDMEDFGQKLPALASGISGFAKTLSDNGFTDSTAQVIDTACKCLKSLVEVSNSIPSSGGVWQKIVGEKDLSSFAQNFPKLGTGVAQFAKALSDGGFDDKKIAVVESAVGVLEGISELNNIDMNKVVEQINALGDKLADFGKKVADFTSSLNNTSSEDLNAASSKVDTVIQIAQKMADFNSEALEKFSNTLSTFGKESLRNFVDALNSQDIKSEAVSAITDLIDKLIEAIEHKKEDIKNKGVELVGKAVEGLKDSGAVSQAESAGKYFAEGFAKGINNHVYLATNAGSNIGKKALEAAQKSIDSHSPSKETYKLGTFFGVGFANGISEYANKVYAQAYSVGDKARIGLSRAIIGISNIMEEGIDDNDFTITPVLDLSEVQSGAAAIGGMFTNPSVGVFSNLSAISTGMRGYRQNGGEEVVSAIDKLGKNLNNTNGDTYNINGITYDDGTEVSEAVKTLVRAARMERRT